MLGHSESVGPLAHAFSPLDRTVKLYSKQPGAEPLSIAGQMAGPLTANAGPNEPTGHSDRKSVV